MRLSGMQTPELYPYSVKSMPLCVSAAGEVREEG